MIRQKKNIQTVNTDFSGREFKLPLAPNGDMWHERAENGIPKEAK
jgi:hypothetical protein